MSEIAFAELTTEVAELSYEQKLELLHIIIDDLRTPFQNENPSTELLEAAEEALRISRDPSVKGYTDMQEMFRDLNS